MVWHLKKSGCHAIVTQVNIVTEIKKKHLTHLND